MLVEHGAGGGTVKIRCLPISVTFGRFVSIAEEATPTKFPSVAPNTKGKLIFNQSDVIRKKS